MPRIAIIGGGLSGLAVAYELNRLRQADFVLYEASPRLGGTVETVRQGGFVLEGGPDSWVTEKPWARELAIELGLEAELSPSLDAHRRNFLFDGNDLLALPEAMRMMVPTDLASIAGSPLFSEAARRAYAEEPARAEEFKTFAANRRRDDDESVASFVERHFGGEVTEKVAGPLLAGIFGGDIYQLSATAVMAPFLRMEREHGSLILAVQKQRRSVAGASVFTTLRGGMQTLTDAMAAQIPDASVRRNEPVLSVARQPAGASEAPWRVRTSRGEGNFAAVVLATPLHVSRQMLRGLLETPLDAELQALLAIEATSAIVAAFGWDQKRSAEFHVPEGFGFLVPPHRTGDEPAAEPKLLACTFVDQKFANRAPEGCTLLRAFYGGADAPGLLHRNDQSILDLASRQLSKAFGALPEAQVTLVRRWPQSLPQAAVGHRARVSRAEEILADLADLYVVGNAFHGVGLPDLVRQGRALAARLGAS